MRYINDKTITELKEARMILAWMSITCDIMVPAILIVTLIFYNYDLFRDTNQLIVFVSYMIILSINGLYFSLARNQWSIMIYLKEKLGVN